MRAFIKQNRFFIILLIVFVIYSLLLIFRSSFIFEGHRYFVLFDDEMISMRYARNLAHGFGMVWNPGGERVEGITNPLWTMYMALYHVLPISPRITSLFIQLTGAAFLLSTLIVLRNMVLFLTKEKRVLVTTLLFTAFYYPLNNWGTVLGTEVSVLTFLLTLSAYFCLRMMKTQSVSWVPFVILGIATLVRFDMFVPLGLLFLSLLFFLPTKRREICRVGLPLLFGFLFFQEGLRYWYYHDLFPNTYYLKMTGYPLLFRMTRGAYVLHFFMNWVLFFIPILGVIFRKNKYMLFLLVLFLGQVLYSVYVGGDAWEMFGGSNRYIAIAMPLFFILFAQSVDTFYLFIRKHMNISKRKILTSVTFFFLCFSFLSFNTRNENMLFYLTLLKPSDAVGGTISQMRMARKIENVTDKTATVVVVWAGTAPYFVERTYLDALGKNDRVIAHEAMHLDPKIVGTFQTMVKGFYPGHMKWDYAYLKNRKPDLFAQVYPEEIAKPILGNAYIPYIDRNELHFYALVNSAKVNRARLAQESKGR